MKIKIITVLLAILTLIPLCSVGITAADIPITVKVDNEKISFPDQKPVIKNDRTLVPVRFVAEALGYKVDWNEADNSAVIDGGKIVMYIDTNKAKIDGKDITLDVASTLINDRTMVPLRIIAETLDCSVDWFGENKMIIINKKNADGSEVSMWERFKQSELFYECTTYESQHYGHLVLKSNYTALTDSQIAEKTKWFIRRDSDMLKYYADSYDCELYAKDYSLKTREQIKDVISVLYPYEYEEANEIMLKTMRGDIWETLRENVPLLISGTWGTRYLDGRTVHMVAGYGLTYFGIQIDTIGYVNPEKPMALTEEQIKDMSAEAKKFYPLSEYGLE